MHGKVESLLQRAQLGEDLARGSVLESFRKYLELLARIELGRRLQVKVDASDIVQEVFLEAHRSFDNFRGAGEAEFVAWLKAILAGRLANTVRHFLGTKRRDIRREIGLEVNLDLSSQALDHGLVALQSTPSQQTVRRESGILLAEALAQLSEDYREVIVLRHFEELTFPDVANRMSRSVDSVQKLWIRALVQLRQMIKDVS